MISPRLHISLFGLKIHSFQFFGIIGFIVGTILGVGLAKYFGLNPWYVLLMSAVGAATFFLLTIISKILFGKEIIVYYHHEISILIFCSIVLGLLHMNVPAYLDITILGIGVFLAFGRIGCFSVGCCHGRPYKQGVTYGHAHVKSGFTDYFEDVKLFPIQLVESAFVFLIVFIGIYILSIHAAPGTVLIVYTVIYGMFRFVLEFFRGDPERPYFKGLSEAQWTTIILVAVTWILARFYSLPLYNWHLVILILLLVVAAYVVLFKRNQMGFRLFSARHIRQIASAMHSLEEQKTGVATLKGATVHLYTTSQGLSFSKGILDNNEPPAIHYTISSKYKKSYLNIQLVEHLAAILRAIRKESRPFTIVQKQQNLYHIIFGETNSMDEILSSREVRPDLFFVRVSSDDHS